MIVPLCAGDSNRSDLQTLVKSLTESRGDAITNDPSSIVAVEINAQARAIYYLICLNEQLKNQANPQTMSVYLDRWEQIMGIIKLPNDNLQTRRNRISLKFRLTSRNPTTQVVNDLLDEVMGDVFLTLLNTTASNADAAFIDGVPITGGITNIVNTDWYSTCQNLFIEVTKPQSMLLNDFYNTINKIYGILPNYLPAWDTFTWFWNGFTDGYGLSTISGTSGSTTITGVGTTWNTTYSNGSYYMEAGSIIEAYDDSGVWRRMTVASVIDNTHLTITTPLSINLTNKKYVIQGFFLDCSPSDFPWPPPGVFNLDNSGLNSH